MCMKIFVQIFHTILQNKTPKKHETAMNIILQTTHPFGVLERVEILGKVGGGRAEAGDHDRARIAPQGVLQEACDLGVAIRDVGDTPPGIAQGTNDIAQGQQASVDVHRL